MAQETLDSLLKRFNKHDIPYISITELRMYQHQGNIIIFDSREKNEFNVSHIPSSIYIGYNDFSVKDISVSFPEKDVPIVVYCTIGIRSETISKKLIDAGYTNVKNLYGGICEWKNKNYKLIDSTNSETENVHTFTKHWSKWLTNGVEVYE
jgi:rhodanese-related sulfurtransferase